MDKYDANKILVSVGYAADRFLKAKFGEKGSSNQDVLANLGKAADVSRAYIFRNFKDDTNRLCTKQLFEWAVNDVNKQIEDFLRFDYEKNGYQRWVSCLSKGEIVEGDIDTFPEIERDILEKRDILSIAVVPIFVNEEWWGFLGFDECRRKRKWSGYELESFKTVAGLIGSFIQRKEVETALRQNEEKYRNTIESIEEGYYEVNLACNFIFVNSSLCQISGYESQELLGLRFHDILSHGSSVELDLLIEKVSVTSEYLDQYPLKLVKKDGSECCVELSMSMIKSHNYCDMLNCGYRGFIKDVSDRKEREKERKEIQATLAQSQKLSAIGELAAGIAHEINNPIAGIINYAYLIKSASKPDSDISIYANSIMSQGDRIGKIVKDLLSFARDDTEEKVPYDIDIIFEESINLQMNSLKKKGIIIRKTVQDRLRFAICNRSKLQQVFLNLLSNSSFALTKKYPKPDSNKAIEIYFSNTSIDGKDWVKIIFKDYGVGISKASLDKVFNPFFTTKTGEGGTGLGMSVSFGIIKDHGGMIDVESKEGRWTKFTIILPASDESGDEYDEDLFA